jgi:AcrR family transcriptional regulator
MSFLPGRRGRRHHARPAAAPAASRMAYKNISLAIFSYVCINRVVKQKTPSRPADKRETAERLLDAAERLFGRLGYDGVGMRALAAEAGVNLGAATYHFGSKEQLYVATFLRRFRSSNAARLRLLREAEAEAKGRPLTVEKIVDCMMRPPFMLGLEHPDFHTLAMRNLFVPPPFIFGALHQEMESNRQIFFTALRRALPHTPPDLVQLREMFLMGTLLAFSMHMNRLAALRNPKLSESILAELVRFVAAGLQSAPAVQAARRPVFPSPPQLFRK